MFTTAFKEKDGFSLIEIRDNSTGSCVEIIPSCGGILHSFNIAHNNDFVNVIDSYESMDDFETNVTAKGFKGSKLSPYACRIKNSTYHFEGATFHPGKFILNGHVIHGLLYDAPFSVVDQQAGTGSAAVTLLHEYRGTEKGYPFQYDCLVTYQLQANNELGIHTQVINRHNGNIPVQDGWHPYFTLGKPINELELTLRTSEQVVFDKEIIPTGELKPYDAFSNGRLLKDTFFDDCFLLDLSSNKPVCVLKDIENALQVEVRPDRSYPYIQLFTPDHRNSIAIENLSAPPDAFNSGSNLIILHPGESAKFATSYIVTSLK